MRAAELIEQFRGQVASGAIVGGQLVVRRGERVLVDVAAGKARGLRDAGGLAVDVTPETRFQVMSASKPVVSLAVAILEDGGALDVSRPVAHYVPGFARHGKGEVTVLDVLQYRSGVLMADFTSQPERWGDWDAVVAAMLDARPAFPRGTLAYQPHSFGWILAEVVRRVSGQLLDEFLAAKLPPSLSGLRLRYEGEAAETYWQGARPHMLAGVDLSEKFELANNRIAARTALVPGAGMYTTAADLAAFYQMLLRGGQTVEGHRLLSASTLARYISVQSSGIDRNFHTYIRLGRGFAFGWPLPHFYGWLGSSSCFGHAGGFSTVAFADPKTDTAIAYVTNSNRGIPDLLRRCAPIAGAARALVG
jgi:CubicO group peptidase (beta-lactamase class C family)